jgi:hypothetical protein
MRALIAALGAATLVSPAAMADEGMWTFDAFPASKVQAAYGFTPDAGWLERIQKASVRLESGCSASVVSRDGLVLTNHHCITDCAANLSSARNDILAKGFLAAQRSEERVCPGLEASILQSIVDVTDRVRSALKDVPADQIATRRAAVFAEIETAACGEDKTIRCDVETFYRGGRYKLYRYERYQDVRLVFAPEQQAAFFGGDPDNFNFPRYAYDMALLRLYRNGAPVRATHFLPLDPTGPDEGELVFTSGHPGSTQRLLTIAQLEFQRDHFLPWRIEYLSQIRGSLLTQSTKGEEEARQAADTLFGVENSVKVMKGQRGALVEPSFFAAKIAEEKGLRDALAARPDLRARYGDPFSDIEGLIAVEKALFMPQQILESRLGGGSVLLVDARALVRAAAERARPEGERLPEFGPSRLPGLERSLLAEAPVHPSLEQVLIEFWLLKTREHLGADHPAVKALFGARSAAEIAAEVAQKSRLGDPASGCGIIPPKSRPRMIRPSFFTGGSTRRRARRVRLMSGRCRVPSPSHRRKSPGFVSMSSATASILTPTSPFGSPMAPYAAGTIPPSARFQPSRVSLACGSGRPAPSRTISTRAGSAPAAVSRIRRR